MVLLWRGCLYLLGVEPKMLWESRSNSAVRLVHHPRFTLPVHSLTMTEEIRADSYVGFDSITQQIEHKLLKRGFQFNVIVVGAFVFLFSVLL